MRTRSWGGLAASLIMGLLLVLLAGTSFPIPGVADPKTYSCADVQKDARYLAYDAETKGQNFGPKVTASDVSGATKELHARRCVDPALTAAHAAYMGVDGYKRTNVTEKATWLKSNPLEWGKLIAKLEKMQEKYDAKLITSKASYETWLFKKAASDMDAPSVLEGSVNPKVARTVLVIGKWEFILNCGLQPRWVILASPPSTPQTSTTTPGTSTPAGPGECTKPPKPSGNGWWYRASDCTWLQKLTPKDPSKDVNKNPDVPAQVRGPGTTPVGSDPGPATKPTDSPTGCQGSCAASPAPAASAPPRGGGSVTLAPPTEPATPASDAPTAPITGTPSDDF